MMIDLFVICSSVCMCVCVQCMYVCMYIYIVPIFKDATCQQILKKLPVLPIFVAI
jgi:hypothetical protein